MSPGPTFDRVYIALKEQLTERRFTPGDHLEPAVLGEELNASITPVRDALHRLVGERIVDAPRNDGFRVPAPTEHELREMYGWNRDLLDLALRARPPDRRGSRDAQQDDAGGSAFDASAPADLFRQIASRSGNIELEAAVENMSDRLASHRRVEIELLDDLEEELALLRTAWDLEDLAALRRLVTAYHRRRQRFVPEILAASWRLRRSS
jgi:DNA-binding FadR family transcriptional regulator